MSFEIPEPVISEHPCPKCGGAIAIDIDCPGYPSRGVGGTRITMVCHPPCGNAWRWDCQNEECGWWYREPSYRGRCDSMGIRPDWMDEDE